MSVKKRKEFTKLNSIIRFALKKLYKKYGYDDSIKIIESMNKPSINEKNLLIEYINELNEL